MKEEEIERREEMSSERRMEDEISKETSTKDDLCISDPGIFHRKEKKIIFRNDSLAQSDVSSKEGRPFVFVFIDEAIPDLKKKSYTALLGMKRYKVRKLYHKEDVTVFTLFKSLLGFSYDVSEFMKVFKVSQISGFIIHPLTKVSDLIVRDNHIILTSRKSGSLGFDSSLRKRRNVFGLDNLGNTCFMASALQCILACNEFVDHFLLINRTLFDISKMPLTKAFHDLVGVGETQSKTFSPVGIKQRLGEKRPIYLEVKEQDAVEFINDFLDVIHEEIVSQTDGKYLSYYSSKGKEDVYYSWLSRNRSIITDLFFSKMKSSIVCTSCKASRSIFEPNLIHSIPVPGDGFYFEEIVLFYESPQKVPLKVFAKRDTTIEELKNSLYTDYDFQYDIFCTTIDSKGGMTWIPDNALLSSLVGTLYCYEYQKGGNSYYWVTIVCKTIWLSYYFDFNFLVRIDPNRLQESLYDVLKSRLTPFLDHRTDFMLYENIEEYFNVSSVEGNRDATDLISRPVIRLDITNYNYKRLFGSGFSPLRSIIQLLSKPVSLSDCINLFLEKEFIFGREKQVCDTCHVPSIFYKKLDFEEFPKYLILQLKRFKFDGRTLEKVDTFIDFPTDYLYIQGVKYKLLGISNHISSSSLKNIGSNGHYTAYVKRDAWYYCNDHNVAITEGPIEKKNAYIFFLERCT